MTISRYKPNMGAIIGVKKIAEGMKETYTDLKKSDNAENLDDMLSRQAQDKAKAKDTKKQTYKEVKLGNVQKDFSVDMDLSIYKKRIKEIVDNSSSKRIAVQNLAIFLSSEFPKLPYRLDMSSGHDGASLEGLDWTKEIVQLEDGSYDYRTLDCSGLVSWCFENAGLEIPGPYGNDINYRDMVGEENIEPIVGIDINKVKPGDLAHTNGHIGVIAEVNKNAKEITVVHTSGSGNGVNITVISTETGKIVKDDTGSAGVDRTGQENYFTEVFHVQYPDEQKAVA